eukprot:CAMPEP_0206548090 /NCGR_PEP_ID=MMETSP0325_2-20121206/13680_1 /ASSEMBLY_ACC=CAM_ASM_000347 /TAXON_ID=2866 /ORGANISM="Crypthecodinium cohnii, Strain Seligo" /LENGTH=731 /DNA_ID=CAMNT_0054047511 /DNA_START=445 /DNA_END=2637 /DNA_ORIENTATION=+
MSGSPHADEPAPKVPRIAESPANDRGSDEEEVDLCIHGLDLLNPICGEVICGVTDEYEGPFATSSPLDAFSSLSALSTDSPASTWFTRSPGTPFSPLADHEWEGLRCSGCAGAGCGACLGPTTTTATKSSSHPERSALPSLPEDLAFSDAGDVLREPNGCLGDGGGGAGAAAANQVDDDADDAGGSAGPGSLPVLSTTSTSEMGGYANVLPAGSGSTEQQQQQQEVQQEQQQQQQPQQEPSPAQQQQTRQEHPPTNNPAANNTAAASAEAAAPDAPSASPPSAATATAASASSGSDSINSSRRRSSRATMPVASEGASASGTTAAPKESKPEAPTRKKAVDMLSRAIRTPNGGGSGDRISESQGQRLASTLEACVFDLSTSEDKYRSKVRGLSASFKRNADARGAFARGELRAESLADAGGEDLLLTQQQRERREHENKLSLERSLGFNVGGLGKFVMGLDCAGPARGCHPECDRRHLDPKEQTRYSWPTKLERSRLIVCAGAERTGSTWLYNAVRLLHRTAKVPCDSYWLGELTEANLSERLAGHPPVVVLVKTHEWHSQYQDLFARGVASRNCKVVLTHRDLRGVCASYRRLKWEIGIPDAYVAEHMQWKQRADLDVAFEDLVRNKGLSVLPKLASELGLSVSRAMCEEVAQDLASLSRSHLGNVVCQVTKLWPDHISREVARYRDEGLAVGSGISFANPLVQDPDYARVLNIRFREYQSMYGYICGNP